MKNVPHHFIAQKGYDVTSLQVEIMVTAACSEYITKEERHRCTANVLACYSFEKLAKWQCNLLAEVARRKRAARKVRVAKELLTGFNVN